MGNDNIATFSERLRHLDRWALASGVALFMLGLLSIFSATYGRSEGFVLRQIFSGGLAAVGYGGAIALGHDRLLRWAYAIFGVTVSILALVLALGTMVKGAQSWVALGPLRLQPSEMGKVVLALALGKHFCRYPPLTFKTFAYDLLLPLVGGVLVLLQPDLGSALVYGVMTLGALVVAGAPKRFLAGLFGAGLLALPVGWSLLKDYQKLRLLVFLDPQIDPLGAGYNVIQSRIAVGAGGLWGKGFLEGTQSKLRFLPEPHTDFIFSVYAEEFGFVGGVLLLVLFGILLWRIFGAGMRSKDLRCKVLAGALGSWIWFQVVECVAMSMGYAPVTGLPMPLFSYGGSALLAVGVGLGIVQSIHLDTLRPYQESEK